MNKKRLLLLITAIFALTSLTLINTVSADPPPCLTTNLCFEEAIKVTNFTGASDLVVGKVDQGLSFDFVTTGWTRDQIRIKTGLGDGTFWGTWTKNMGNGTYEVDIADFNGDNKPDIIATNKEQDRVYIRWGHNNWTGASVWQTDDGPHLIATGDFNNDGLDDFASGNDDPISGESITVRLRLPGGGFSNLDNYSAYRLGDVAFNDCDHDGDLDMFFTTVDRHEPEDDEALVRVLINRGDGVFSSVKVIDMNSVGDGLALGKIAFGNLNEDGWDDLVVTRNDQKLVLALGYFDCGFQNPVLADVEGDPTSLEIADMNWDGHLDVLVGYQYEELIEIYLGQGNGSLTGPYEPELTLDWRLNDIGVGDFNLDGRKDILYAEQSGVWLLLARDQNAPPWEPPWIEVNGIPYVPAGGAQAYTVNNTIIVNGFGTSGQDGLDVLLDSAKLFSADIDIEGRVGSKVYLDTIANENVASSIGLISGQSGLEIWPVFNPTTYRIEYLLDDQVQLALTIPSNNPTPAAVVNWDEIWCLMEQQPSEICHIIYQTGIYGDIDDGIDDIGIWVPSPLLITAANGNLVAANHIRMVEIPDGQNGSARHGFSRVEIRGALLDSLTLSNMLMESAEPPLSILFPFDNYLPLIVR